MTSSLFDLAEQRLAWLDRRQGVLAQNIANANTPHYRARDLVPFAARLGAAQSASDPVRTSPLHLAGTLQGIDQGVVTGGQGSARAGERAPDGNAVQIDTQLTQVVQTDTDQELVTDLYKKYMNLYRIALGR